MPVRLTKEQAHSHEVRIAPVPRRIGRSRHRRLGASADRYAERLQPVLYDGDVDPLQPVEVAAVGGVAVAGHRHLVAAVERRTAGVTETRTTGAAVVVLV